MSELPFWFERALQTPSQSGEVFVEGANIAYSTWGDVGKPGIILIHGSNAHLEWWRFTAPFLADNFRVAALDLSGNGDSGWRSHYSGELFAKEVWAVCEAAQLGPKPFIVGHSFGGFVALETCHYHDADVGGMVLMDFTVAPPEQYLEWGKRAERENVKPGRKLRIYPEKETALGRFRLLPEQPGVHSAVLQHMAEYGLKHVDGGWTWKFDPALFDHMEMGIDQRDKYAALSCRSALILGENSDDEGAYFADHMLEITRGHLPVVTLPGTYHHLMFDDPMALAMSTKILLLEWLRQDHEEEYRAGLIDVIA